jgi:hypothetical protein
MGLSPFDLTAVKKSSLIFQLTNRLLLHPEQYKQPGANDGNQVDNQSDVMNADETLFNSLLMLRLVGNKQFISELQNTEIQPFNIDYKNDKIVQLSDYPSTSEKAPNITAQLLQFRSSNKS